MHRILFAILFIFSVGCARQNNPEDLLHEKVKPISFSEIETIPLNASLTSVEELLGESHSTELANIKFYPGQDNKDGYLFIYWSKGSNKDYFLRVVVKMNKTLENGDMPVIWPLKCKGQKLNTAWKNTE